MELKENKALIIVNPKELARKIDAIKKDGKDNVHVLTDFDRTLTKALSNNKKTPSIISILRNPDKDYLSKEYVEKAHELYNKYHPIEISTKISMGEKKAKMLEWWKSHYKLLVECGLDETTINQSIENIKKEGILKLREGSTEFFNLLNKNNIPLIIMSSSGIGNMVIKFLKGEKVMHNNIHFIGNTLEFDKGGKFIGIKDNEIIHSFNKNEIELKNLPIYKEIINRKNIILIGDSLGDLGMIEGSEYKTLIKIAFFNYPDEENLEDFKKNFDIIILNDGGFEPINQLMKEIL